VGVNYFAIPRYGIMGAALTTLLSYAVIAFLLYPVSMRLHPITYEWGRILKIIIAVLAVYLPGFFLGGPLFKLVCALLFPAVLFALRFFNQEELAKVKSLMGRR
jgi:O-antigen/teichoic acid export membrane protein